MGRNSFVALVVKSHCIVTRIAKSKHGNVGTRENVLVPLTEEKNLQVPCIIRLSQVVGINITTRFRSRIIINYTGPAKQAG